MKNKEKFMKLVSGEKSDTIERNKERIKNRAMLRESQQIALKVILKLNELNWSQKDLACKLNISPQQINKIVQGKENLTLETLVKLQDVLEIALLATYYESDNKREKQLTAKYEEVGNYDVQLLHEQNYISSKPIRKQFTESFALFSNLEAAS